VTVQPAGLAPYVGSYIAGVNRLSMEFEGEELRLHGPLGVDRLAFIGHDRAYVSEGPDAPQGVRFHPAAGQAPAWIEFQSGMTFDFNDRADDPPGPIGDEYDALLGDYAVIQWGVPLFPAPLSKRNGYLYLGEMRLTEHAPGLLFTADGEAVDLRGEPPTARNIVLRRTA
jgi:hypothetical protein